jgi:L-alanine-DL-glutamate epimerase-like enolase superfamily enzyme
LAELRRTSCWRLQGIVDQGWTAVKMKVGKNPREDTRARLARRALGDDIDLMTTPTRSGT